MSLVKKIFLVTSNTPWRVHENILNPCGAPKGEQRESAAVLQTPVTTVPSSFGTKMWKLLTHEQPPPLTPVSQRSGMF